ncbi:MAG: hypothetical protein LJE68_15030 [Rhodobacter sp.]|nr:hypothetical protein [Rhodobacter sp.]
MRVWIGAAALMLVAGAAAGDPVDGATAKKMLFPVRGADVVMQPDSGLDDAQSATMAAILKQMKAEGLGNYYGAAVVSPTFFTRMAADPGQAALSGLLQITEKMHSPDIAASVAMSACTKARKSGDAPCVVAAHILPRKWQPQEVSLSVNATQAFKAYRKGSGPKALAISAGSPAYAVARGEGATQAALQSCNAAAAEAGAPDCKIVIAD